MGRRDRWGMGPARERLFEKGDLKYVLLDLLRERPRHGYDLIRALEERFQGQYTASPGTIYPVLSLLEDMGLVSVEAQEGRKVYTVTSQGHAFLEERQDTVREIWQRTCGQCGGEEAATLVEAMHAFRDLATTFAGSMRARQLSPQRAAKLCAWLRKSRVELQQILEEE